MRGTLCEIPRRCSVRRAQFPVSPLPGHWDSRQDDLGHNHESQSACPIYWTARDGTRVAKSVIVSCHSYLLSVNSCGCTIGSGIGALPGFHGVFAINIGETFELGGAAEYGALYGQVGGSKLDVVSQRVVFPTQTYSRDGPGPQLRGSNCPARIYLFLHRPKKERAGSHIAFQQRKRISAASTTALSKRQIRSSAPPSYSSCTSQGPLHPG